MGAVLGLVLCGGESLRMGRDKALVDLDGRNLLARAVDVIAPVVDEVVLGTGSKARYEELGLRCILDAESGAGPLGGLCAGLEELDRSGGEWLVVAACDTPRLESELFRVLLERAIDAGADGCLLESHGGVEPLCAVYRRSCFGPAKAALDLGKRRVNAFFGDVDLVFVKHQDLPHSLRGRDLGFNVNTPVDLELEQTRLAEAGGKDEEVA